MTHHEQAMAGDGYYNAHSPQQAEIAVLSHDALRRAAESVPPTTDASVVADYGSSQGRNSLGPVRVMLDGLRRARPAPAPLSVVHTDLPGNDWSTLFETIAGPDSYLVGHDAVFPSAIGRSFYEPLLPAGSVAIGWSGTSVLWLSARPDVGPGNLFSALATGADRQRWATAAARDWRTFLTHRERELAPGGRLVVSSLQASDVYPPFLRLLVDAVQGAVDDGAITDAEAGGMTVPTYLRTREEIEAPFADPGSSLAIVEHTSFVAVDPAYAAFAGHGDAARFAREETAQIRGWSEPSLAAALDPGRGPGGIRQAVDAVFASIQRAVGADPARGHCDWTMSLLTIARPA